MRFLGYYVMRGRMQAVVVAVVFVLLSLLLPPLNMVSAAAIALVTLRRGYREGFVTMFGSSVAVGILGQILFGSPEFVIAYAAGFWLPVWLFSILLRESGRLGLTLDVAIVLGFLVIIGIYLYAEDPASLWQERLQLVTQPLLKNPPTGIEPDDIEIGIQTISHYMTGILVAGSVISLISAMLLGRWWQALLFNPGGFRKEFLNVRSHTAIAYLALLAFGLAWLGGALIAEAMKNVGILVFFFYLIFGIAVLHGWICTTTISRWLLPLAYTLMLLVPHVLLPVALLGLTDPWANWRGRFIAR
ncbi:MAG: hypothetical protein ACU843_04920 [Gammaproteobacteria bacterium]